MKKTTLLSSLLTLSLSLWTLGSSAQMCLQPLKTFAAGYTTRSVITADFNGDGKKDLVTANFYDNTISVLLGDGAGNFSAPTNFTVGTYPTSVAAADFNADGKMDVAVANNNSNTLSIL